MNMKKKDSKLQVTQKRALAPENSTELKTAIKDLLSKPVNGAEAQLDRHLEGNPTKKKARKLVMDMGSLFNLDNFSCLRELVTDWSNGRATEFGIQLYKEYNCQTASEKALAQTVVIAFEHILDYSRRLHAMLETTGRMQVMDIKTYPLILKRIQIIGLELDRANRQFLTALQTLKQIKAPQLEVNVKTKTAFVAQNQQFNVENKPGKGEEEKQNETI
ncbi:MAG: hypothetical protein US40_C0007G0057 [Candidatus Roizmanbacteria bacterium GW2011_GWC2_37_13]|uniref:Uncharacterized protein n=1 Tax=Candidatus Roizmanbacteria bacterium GW2011_GWC2_37_13 TaxID=1618486 RepID=A0A0G0G307_9BACT|nr:MAG: hypothetical protein US38_C0012G0060 [Candidatus Roizmanbacteria bacterium GW2011_GWC1_37_12]KKQ25558.1 MAG: hypothetical protein US40_C0007G0057 [Candidatus Roizmanbacteria bacterium GW2011_GWC2_37_13]